MSENLDIGNLDLSSIQIDDLKELLKKIGDVKNFDYSSLDEDDSDLSGDEQKIKDRLTNIGNEKEFIEFLIYQVELINKAKAYVGEEEYNKQKKEEKKPLANSLEELKANLGKISIRAYTIEEAENAYEILSNEYKNFKKEGKIRRAFHLNNFHDSINDIKTRSSLNIFQDKLLKKILGANKGFNKNYIKGYDNERGNYLVKLSNFEKDIKKGAYNIIGDVSNPKTINSLLLSNYILKIKKDGDLNVDFLKSTFSEENLKDLYKIFNKEYDNETTILRKNLTLNNAYSPLREALHEMRYQLDDDLQESFNMENKIKKQSDEYFLEKNEDGEYENIYYITNKEQLYRIIEKIKNKNSENALGLNINLINSDLLRQHPEIIIENEIDIAKKDINLIPNEIFKNEKFIIKLFSIYSHLAFEFFTIALSYNVSPNIIKKIISSLEETTKIPDAIQEYIGKKEKTSEKTFLELYNKVSNANFKIEMLVILPQEEKDMCSYILNNPEKTQKYLVELINNGYLGDAGQFLDIGKKSLEHSKALLQMENGLDNIKYLDSQTLLNPEIINIIFTNKNLKEEQSMLYFQNSDIRDINTLLYIFKCSNKIIDENLDQKTLTSYVNIFLSKSIIKHKLYIATKEKQVVKKEYSELFERFKQILNNAGDLDKQINYTGNFLSNIVVKEKNNYKEQKNNIEIKKNLTAEVKIREYFKIFFEKNKLENTQGIDNIIKHLTSGSSIEYDKGAELLLLLLGKNKKSELFKEANEFLISYKIEQINEEEVKKEIQILGDIGVYINENSLKYEKGMSIPLVKSSLNTSIGVFLRKNNINSVEKFTDEQFIILKKELEKDFIINSSDADLKQKITDRIIENLKNNQKRNEFGIKKDNIDAYVTYLSNPKKEGTFEEYLEEEKKIQRIESDADKGADNSTDTISSGKFEYSLNSGTISINTKNGTEKQITLSETEKKLVHDNPENLDNIVDFYKVLDEVGLGKLWKIKENIFKSISNVKGIGFNIKDDYLNENETKIFLNSVLKSCGENEIPNVFTIDNFISSFEQKNGVQSSGEEKDVNMYGEAKIERIFIEKYFPRGSAIGFKNSEFEKELGK